MILMSVWIITLGLWPAGCEDKPTPGSPHATMIGHWKKVDRQWIGDKASFERTEPSDVDAMEVYISAKHALIVDPGESPKRVSYEVLEENQEDFWLKMCTATPGGTKTYSLVTFSPDRQGMSTYVRQDIYSGHPEDIKRIIHEQIGGVTAEDTYRRVDDKTSP